MHMCFFHPISSSPFQVGFLLHHFEEEALAGVPIASVLININFLSSSNLTSQQHLIQLTISSFLKHSLLFSLVIKSYFFFVPTGSFFLGSFACSSSQILNSWVLWELLSHRCVPWQLHLLPRPLNTISNLVWSFLNPHLFYHRTVIK